MYLLLKGKTRHLFYSASEHKKDVKTRAQFASTAPCVITPLESPPLPQSVAQWARDHQITAAGEGLGLLKEGRTLSDSTSLLEGPSLNNTYGFKLTPEVDRNLHTDPHVSIALLYTVQ